MRDAPCNLARFMAFVPANDLLGRTSRWAKPDHLRVGTCRVEARRWPDES
jgi:hypothetical protein